MIVVPLVNAVACCWMVVPMAIGEKRPMPRWIPLRSSDQYMNFLEQRIQEQRAKLAAIEKERAALEARPRVAHAKEIEQLRQQEFFLSREIILCKRELSRIGRPVVNPPQSYMPIVPRVAPKPRVPPKPKVWD